MIDTAKTNSPGWWLDYLAKKLAAKQRRIALLRQYMDGNAPLPEGAEGMRPAYQSVQKKSRTNWGELVVEAVQERMMPAGFLIGDEKELDKQANAIWAANQLDVLSGDVHTDMLGVSEGYVIVGPAESAVERSGVFGWLSKLFAKLTRRAPAYPIITPEDPALVVTEHDPLIPTRVVAALKMFRDSVEGCDYAYLYLPGVVYVAKREAVNALGPTVDVSGFEWVEGKAPMSWPEGFEDVVPVVRFPNRKGKGEFETNIDVIDRINFSVLQRLVVMALQAFRQRAIKGELPETRTVEKADGTTVEEPIDYGEIFRPGPGALWMLPEGAELWESGVTDLTPVLESVKADIRDLAAATRTPMSMLLPDGQNQSAEGATFAREGLVFKTKDRIERATYGWNQVMALALRFMGQPYDAVKIQWLDPERRSLAERADAASKAVDLPFGTKLRYVWQFSPEEAERIEQERTDDIMAGLIEQPAPNSGV